MIGAPTWQRLGEAFEFCWPERRITLSNFRESSGDLKVELSPEVVEGEGWAPLSGLMVLNLLSARTRNDTAKVLNSRDDSFPWHDAIEAVAVIAVREYRRGGPIVSLSQIEAPDQLSYLLDRVIVEHETNIVFGDGEAGKSLFAMFVAVSVATGNPLPRGLTPLRLGNVLYLDYESDPAEHARRLRKISAGMGLFEPPENVFYRESHRPVHEEASMLAREVAKRDIDLVIVDSLAPACGDDPSLPGAAIATMNALRAIGATRLAIGHVNRSDRDRPGANQTTFGSIFWRNLTRSMWQMLPNQDATAGGSAPFGLFNRKSNNAARERWPLGFQFVFGPDDIALQPYDVRATDGLADGVPSAERIRTVLRTGKQSITQIAESLGLDPANVRTALGRMPDAMQIEPAVPGRNGKPAVWGLRSDRGEE